MGIRIAPTCPNPVAIQDTDSASSNDGGTIGNNTLTTVPAVAFAILLVLVPLFVVRRRRERCDSKDVSAPKMVIAQNPDFCLRASSHETFLRAHKSSKLNKHTYAVPTDVIRAYNEVVEYDKPDTALPSGNDSIQILDYDNVADHEQQPAQFGFPDAEDGTYICETSSGAVYDMPGGNDAITYDLAENRNIEVPSYDLVSNVTYDTLTTTGDRNLKPEYDFAEDHNTKVPLYDLVLNVTYDTPTTGDCNLDPEYDLGDFC